MLISIFSTLVVNVKGAYEGYYGFYYPDEEDTYIKENKLLRGLNNLTNLKYYREFLTYTGLETGFGFFAPNVASDYLTKFSIYDNDSLLITEKMFPELSQKESRRRIASAYSMFVTYIQNPDDSLNVKKCDIFLNSMANNQINNFKNSEYVEIKLFLYHFPSIEQLTEDKNAKEKFILIRRKIFTRDQSWK
jgi:hypothetical protein